MATAVLVTVAGPVLACGQGGREGHVLLTMATADAAARA
jgi:hypothetical protein